MAARRRDDVDDVRTETVEQFADVRENLRPWWQERRERLPVRHRIGHANDLHVRERTYRFEVLQPHLAAADEADAEGTRADGS